MNANVTTNWIFVGAAFGVTYAAMLGYLIHLRGTMRRSRAALDRTGALSQEHR